jgi:monothiol glutaredoxin
MNVMSTVFDIIDNDVKTNDIVLFMKGTAHMPQCGFSAAIVQVLQSLGLTFRDINVLADPEIRQGIKDYSSWPTIPQLFIKGQFIGGCDIVREMYESGELKDVLTQEGLLPEA